MTERGLEREESFLLALEQCGKKALTGPWKCHEQMLRDSYLDGDHKGTHLQSYKTPVSRERAGPHRYLCLDRTIPLAG